MGDHILFIVGDDIQSESIRTELQRFGLNIETVSQSVEVETLKCDAPGAIVMDTCSQAKHGYTLCHELSLRRDLSHIPIILLVCENDIEAAPLATQVGAYDYIARDMFVVRNLVEVLRQLQLV